MWRACERWADRLDSVNRRVGEAVRWLAVAMLLVQIAVVVLRYVFATSFIWAQETVLYLHAALFMMGAGYTLLADGHVRVDIFYGGLGPRGRAAINLFGVVCLLLPTVAVLLWATRLFVWNAWAILEGPISVGGIPASFLLKTLIPVFALLIGLQGIALGLRSLAVLTAPRLIGDVR